MTGVTKSHVLLGTTLFLTSSLAACFWSSFEVRAQSLPSHASLSTEDRLEESTWWPTKGVAARDEYVGIEECANCHSSKAASQSLTAMAHASCRTVDSDVLHGKAELIFRQPPYDYRIVRSNQAVLYSVSNGRDSLSRSLIWAFGLGNVGQTYIYEASGNIFESRVSFYRTLNALDITAGHPGAVPYDLQDSGGRLLMLDEARRCFGCHTTAATTRGRFDPRGSFAGVTCEACHGPGAKHVAAMMAGRIEEGKKQIQNPKELDPAASVDFCGACHRTWGDVIQMGIPGKANVRFQPYRLERSLCWGKGDPRLTCIACHNPHEPLIHDADNYDRYCLRCHEIGGGARLAANHSRAVCPVSTKHCVTCHMPKVDLPDMHYAFTDHRIRVVRSGQQYPN